MDFSLVRELHDVLQKPYVEMMEKESGEWRVRNCYITYNEVMFEEEENGEWRVRNNK
jgi:hypothetical protein